jgi:LPS-assembly protein
LPFWAKAVARRRIFARISRSGVHRAHLDTRRPDNFPNGGAVRALLSLPLNTYHRTAGFVATVPNSMVTFTLVAPQNAPCISMKRKLRFLVNISVFLCHLISLIPRVSAQVTPQLHSRAEVEIKSDEQQKTGDLYHLTGHVRLDYLGMSLTADQMDYNAESGEVHAQGNLHFLRPQQNEDISGTEGTYNLRNSTGTFFHAIGSIGARVRGKASLLTTSNPFFFEAEKVEKVEDGSYRVHDATITVCTLPDPTWRFAAPNATIRPEESAYIYHSKLRVFGFPVFYFPVFYRSLRHIPRSTGFLMPTVGNNSRLGTFIGDSFFWAINRSMDAEIGGQYLSKRGWSQVGTFRMRGPSASYLNVSYFGVVDRGLGPQQIDQGGRSASALGTMPFSRDIRGVLDLNYLSSLTFRQAFTQTYNEAVYSENHSTAFLTKSSGSYSVNSLFSILQDYQSTQPHDIVTIRHLPDFQFNSLERPLLNGFPLLLAWDSSAGVVSRTEPTITAGRDVVRTNFLERFEFFPRISMPLGWKDFHLMPVFGYRVRRYGDQVLDGQISNEPLNQGTAELSVELDLPPLSRVFSSGGLISKGPVKHVIEPRITFHNVSGADGTRRPLLFDETDLVTNTRDLEFSLTNRLLAKRQAGAPVQEVLSWELKQQYYFTPSFGGAVQPEQRNVFLPTLEFSGNAFLLEPRRFSPIVSILRFRPFAHYDIEFRQDYDTTEHQFTNAAVLSSVGYGLVFASVSQFIVKTPNTLSPPSDQTHFTVGYGRQGRTGLNAAFTGAYDVRAGFMQFSAVQVSYNNNCCGISVEYRRFALGPVRNENQYRMSFSLANVGTFGNLKKEERLF